MKAGSAIVVLAAIQISVVLLATRFYRRTQTHQNLVDFTNKELDRVETQLWLLRHVASWYVGPIMVGCFLITWGRDPWWRAIACSVFFLLFSAFLVWVNRYAAKKRLVPIRDELRNTLLSLEENFQFPEPRFARLENMRIMNIVLMLIVVMVSLLVSGLRMLPAAELSVKEARDFGLPLIDAELVDGLSIGIIDGQQQFTVHLGHADGAGAAPNDQTLYEIGSVTKVFTALLLAEAAAEDPQLLTQSPGAADTDVALPTWKDQAMTWLDFATHRTGLPRLPDNMKYDNLEKPYVNYDSAKAIEFLSKHQLRRRPGSQYEYSNFAVSWLGYMLAKRSGVSYEQLLADRITKPLAMNDTVVTLLPNQKDRFATPHSSYATKTSSWEFADLPGAGGIRSSTADMMKFMAAQLDRPDSKLGQAMELAWQQHHAGDGKDFAMGLGWLIARDGQTRFHNGQTGGFHSSMFINRERSVAVVVLANTAVGKEVDTLAEQLTQRLAGLNIQPQKLHKPIQVDPEIMARLVGRYELVPSFVFDVQVVDGRLMVGVTNQPTQEVYAKSNTRWFYKVVDAELDFQLGETGNAQAVVLHQNGMRQTAKRIDQK